MLYKICWSNYRLATDTLAYSGRQALDSFAWPTLVWRTGDNSCYSSLCCAPLAVITNTALCVFVCVYILYECTLYIDIYVHTYINMYVYLHLLLIHIPAHYYCHPKNIFWKNNQLQHSFLYWNFMFDIKEHMMNKTLTDHASQPINKSKY